MAGFFYIRILICFAVVSAIAVTLLGLYGQMLQKSRTIENATQRLRYCINSLEKAKAGIETEAQTENEPQLGPNYHRIIIRHEGFSLETAQLVNQNPIPEEPDETTDK